MAQKKKPLFLICPICGQEKSAKTEFSSLSKKWQDYFAAYDDPEDTFVRNVKTNGGFWCCSSCFKKHHGIWATCGWISDPIAYFDTPKTCTNCKEPFISTARHQHQLYEEIGISHHIPIDRCEKCQRAYKAKKTAVKHAMKRIGDLHEKEEPNTLNQLLEISTLYCILEYPEKAELYLRRAKNLANSKRLEEDFFKKVEEARKGNSDFDLLCQRIPLG